MHIKKFMCHCLLIRFYKFLTTSLETLLICNFLKNMVNSLNQVTSLEWSYVSLSNDISMQSVTSERRYNTLNMDRSQTKCAKIQNFESWPVNPPFKVNGVKRIFPFKCWLSHIDGAVGGLIHMQLSQIRYNFKAEHPSFLAMNKSKQSLWNADEWKAVFNLLRSGIVSTENVLFWHIWLVTHPCSRCHIFAQN